jgi:hypothetical protein
MSFNELQIGMSTPPEFVMVGEVEAGRPSKVRKQINSLIKGVNTFTFDIAELLHEVKTKNYYEKYGYNTFKDFAEELPDFKLSKAYYLVRIIQNMQFAGIPRETYETIAISKLRLISRLKPEDGTDATGSPIAETIKTAVNIAATKPLEDVKGFIAAVEGLTGEDAMVWLNVTVKQATRDNVIRPALDMAKKQLGTKPDPNNEGMHVDASDGRALEAVCADFLSDPNNAYDADLLKQDE